MIEILYKRIPCRMKIKKDYSYKQITNFLFIKRFMVCPMLGFSILVQIDFFLLGLFPYNIIARYNTLYPYRNLFGKNSLFNLSNTWKGSDNKYHFSYLISFPLAFFMGPWIVILTGFHQAWKNVAKMQPIDKL